MSKPLKVSYFDVASELVEIVYSDGEDDFISPYEKMREQRVKENNQKLLSLVSVRSFPL